MLHKASARLFKNILLSSAALISVPALSGEWLVGAGMYDITGPAADRGMVGYGNTAQTTQGIHTRLWSRAFTMGKTGTDNYIIFVSADIQSITQGVHQAVMKKIANNASLSPYLSQDNVMITATHTHVGPGGYDHNAMLNMTALGYDSDNFNVIVDGIYNSIVSAFNAKSEGEIKFAQGQLTDTGINRSTQAYAMNPDADDYSTDTNQYMTVLKLVKDNGDEIGMIDWFGIHNVAASQDFRLISGDNKGVASQMFETLKGTQPPLTQGFVAAFANSEEGDVSPNICGVEDACGATTEESVLLVATKQYDKALSLYNSANINVSGDLAHQFQYVNMPGYVVDQAYTGTGSDETVCEGTIGWSMTAGQFIDGPSNIPGIVEGMTQDNEGSVWNENDTLFGNIFSGYPLLGVMNALSDITVGSNSHEACQAPKPTFLNTQLIDGVALYTDVLPFQMFQIGRIALVGVPGEMTTMSARRLRTDLKAILASRGVENVIIAGLANAYSGYITTPEEYSIQHYAGGHTIFGPNTLAAHRQVFSLQANAIVNNSQVSTGPTPDDLSDDQIINVIGVVYDDKRLWESFGEVTSDAASTYFLGDTASVTIRSGHPQNNFKTMDSYLKVQQKQTDGSWKTVLTENDVSTEFHWIRDTDVDCLACSSSRLEWVIGDELPSGTYRLKHNGHWKNGWDGSINSYSGTSRDFYVYTNVTSITGVSLLGAHGKYLRAAGNGGGDVRADRTSIGSHETFSLLDLDEDSCLQSGDTVSIRTGNNHFFKGDNIETSSVWSWDSWSFKTVESGGGLDASASALGSWERFTLSNHSDGSGCLANGDTISLKSSHNRYAVAESNDDANANRKSVGSWEKFKVVF
ncbi:MAG: neutral/alkaline non-lysosomal ceramidase N-terminal domain-containing protein [Bermanella sp.]